jgi:hypothetical protein
MKTSEQRILDHEFVTVYPRGLDVDDDGLLKVSMRREVRNTVTGNTILPQGEYTGLIGKFISQVTELIQSLFVPAVTKLIEESLEEV